MKVKVIKTVVVNSEPRAFRETFRARRINWVRCVNPRGDNFYPTRQEWDEWVDVSEKDGSLEEDPCLWSDSGLTMLYQEGDRVMIQSYNSGDGLNDEDKMMRDLPEKIWYEFFN